MSKYPLKLQRPRVFAFCEGETEVALFYFLKIQYWDNGSSKVSFGIAKNMGGFSDFKVFKRMYAKLVKGIGFTKKDVKDIKFLFIIDNDLADSKTISDFIEAHGHLVQLCNPNPEGMILDIIGKPQAQTVGDKDYRNKCKNAFKSHFGCKAHKWLLKEDEVKDILTKDVFKKSLPVLHDLFKE